MATSPEPPIAVHSSTVRCTLCRTTVTLIDSREYPDHQDASGSRTCEMSGKHYISGSAASAAAREDFIAVTEAWARAARSAANATNGMADWTACIAQIRFTARKGAETLSAMYRDLNNNAEFVTNSATKLEAIQHALSALHAAADQTGTAQHTYSSRPTPSSS